MYIEFSIENDKDFFTNFAEAANKMLEFSKEGYKLSSVYGVDDHRKTGRVEIKLILVRDSK
jgi:hypothetical protein